MYGGETAAVRIVHVGAAPVQRVQALGRRADVHGPAQQPVQLVPVGRRVNVVRVEPVVLDQLHEVRPPVARAHRVGQVAPDGVLPYDNGQLDLRRAGRLRARGRRVRQTLYEQELLDVGPPVAAVFVRRAVAAAGPVPKTVPSVLERRLRRRGPGRGRRVVVSSAADAVPVVHVQTDGPVQRHGRRGRGHFQMVSGGGHRPRGGFRRFSSGLRDRRRATTVTRGRAEHRRTAQAERDDCRGVPIVLDI